MGRGGWAKGARERGWGRVSSVVGCLGVRQGGGDALLGELTRCSFPLLHQGQGGANPGDITGPLQTYACIG